ncbi:MAG: hypothetical protein ACKVGZ_06825 [Alphaproteobacteria bacterium]|jgi:hypothetical protein
MSRLMSDKDQEIAAEMARIRTEWQRLEAECAVLEAECAEWRDDLLATADRIGLGERVRGIRHAGKSQQKKPR